MYSVQVLPNHRPLSKLVDRVLLLQRIFAYPCKHEIFVAKYLDDESLLDRQTMQQAADIFESALRQSMTFDFNTMKLPQLSEIQFALSSWQNRNFGPTPAYRNVLGVCEEAGELAHAMLKHEQKIRGMDDDMSFKIAASDAIGDILVYLMQLCTALRLDFGTILLFTSLRVMRRTWKSGQVEPEYTGEK